MVNYLVKKMKPSKGFAHFMHVALIAFVPLAMFLFVRLDLNIVALAVLMLSKWRMFAVRPKYWLTHVRTNAVDLIVGLSFLIFMISSFSLFWQIFWVVAHEIWLVVLKPKSSPGAITIQSLTAQSLGLVGLFLAFVGSNLVLYMIGFWLVSYFSARHFLGGFDEKHNNLIASVWAFFSASFIWVLGHWLIFLGQIAQPALLISVLAFSLSGLYFLDRYKRLTKTIKQQILFVMFAMIFIMVIFSDWGDRAL